MGELLIFTIDTLPIAHEIERVGSAASVIVRIEVSSNGLVRGL